MEPLLSTEATIAEPRRRKRRRRRCKRHPKEGPHSPNCRGQKNVVCNNGSNNGQNLVRILPTMKPILDYLQVTGEIFTREEIMGHLIEYIKRKSLFDPEDPRKVYCENDELADIFGCNEFSTANACELLLRNLQAINNPAIKQESHSSEWNVCGPYSCNSSSYVKYRSVSTTDTCSCSESDQQSTNEASTSSHLLPSTSSIVREDRAGSKRRHDDACSDTSHPVRQHSELFYGIGYMLSGYNSSLPSEDSDRPLGEYGQHYKHVCGNVTDIVSDTSDDLFFLNETDEDPQKAETDEDQFLEEYEPISYSEEEQMITGRRRNEEEEEVNSFNATEDEGEEGGDELGNSDVDSEIEEDDKWQCESCAERNHPMTRHCRRCWALRKNWCPPALNRSISEPVSLENNIAQTDPISVSDCATTSHNIDQGSMAYWGDTCYICQKEPRNGCIVHGNTGHQVCCVGCAKQLKEQRKPCPVCRKKIYRVIQNFL